MEEPEIERGFNGKFINYFGLQGFVRFDQKDLGLGLSVGWLVGLP